jgi:hypothetical protein
LSFEIKVAEALQLLFLGNVSGVLNLGMDAVDDALSFKRGYEL